MKIPVLSGKDLIKALGKIGYIPVRQAGSHIQLKCEGRKSVTIPNHSQIGKGLLRKIMRDAHLSLEELINLLRN